MKKFPLYFLIILTLFCSSQSVQAQLIEEEREQIENLQIFQGSPLKIYQNQTYSLLPKIETWCQKGRLSIQIQSMLYQKEEISAQLCYFPGKMPIKHWLQLEKDSEGNFGAEANLRDYHYGIGNYQLTLYHRKNPDSPWETLTAKNLSLSEQDMPSPEEQQPLLSLENLDPISASYELKVRETPLSRRLLQVSSQVWSREDRANLKTHALKETSPGQWSIPIQLAEHELLSGIYHNQILLTYADASSESIMLDSPSISTDHLKANLEVTELTSSTLQISANQTPQLGEIYLEISSQMNDENQILPTHMNEQGDFQSMLLLVDYPAQSMLQIAAYRSIDGKSFKLAETSYQVPAPKEEKEQIKLNFSSLLPSFSNAPNTYPVGQCTWGAKELAPWAGNTWGNGGDWTENARLAGFQIGKIPQVGAIICWTDGGYGHVGIVIEVESQTKIQILEANYASNPNIHNYRGWFNPLACQAGEVNYIYPPS